MEEMMGGNGLFSAFGYATVELINELIDQFK